MLDRFSKDIYFTSNGDFDFDLEHDDVRKVDSRRNEIHRQAIIRRLMTKTNDFAYSPSYGANITSFVGLRNTAETGELIKAAVITELNKDNLFRPGSVEANVFPLNETSVGIILTGKIRSVESDGFIVGFSYDLRNNQMIPRRNSLFRYKAFQENDILG